MGVIWGRTKEEIKYKYIYVKWMIVGSEFFPLFDVDQLTSWHQIDACRPLYHNIGN